MSFQDTLLSDQRRKNHSALQHHKEDKSNMPLTELTQAMGVQRAAHLLRRCGWGGKINEINEFASLTPIQAFEKLMDSSIPDPILPAEGRNRVSYVALNNGNYIKNPNSFRDANQNNVFQWHHEVALMTGYGGVPDNKKAAFIFRERICYFLYTLFPTEFLGGRGLAGWTLQQLFRIYAFDKVDIPAPKNPAITLKLNMREMIKKMLLSETIMIQLDGQINFKSNPNENLGRELLELYTIGRGLEGFVPETPPNDYFTHTEEDVQAASKVLTGWTFRNNEPDQFDPETGLKRAIIRTFAGSGPDVGAEHDNSLKQFSDRFGNATVVPNPDLFVNGRASEASMLDEIDQLVNIIFDQRETARHLCRRLYRFFVHYQIDQNLSDDIIEQMTDTFIASDFKLYPVLKLLMTSKHFFDGEDENDSSKIGSLIKSPHDLFVGLARIMDTEAPNPYTSTDDSDFERWSNRIRNASFSSGLTFHGPPTVAGHPAYFQFPVYNRSWLSSNWLATRYDYIKDAITTETRPDRLRPGNIIILPWVRDNFPDSIAGDARKLVIAVATYFLPLSDNLSFDENAASPITIARLSSFLNSFLGDIDAEPEQAWTNRYINRIDEETVARQLENLFDSILQSPEYQLL
ncbi:MAG: DUF1800 family protein [Bacteroidota bacterium]